MSAQWAGVLVAALALALTAGGIIGRWIANGAKRDAKVDAVLEQLTNIAGDHETRLRRGRL